MGFCIFAPRRRRRRTRATSKRFACWRKGFGYWRGATEAHQRAAAEYQARSLDPAAVPQEPPAPFSFFDKLADPPTILADWHEQQRRDRAARGFSIAEPLRPTRRKPDEDAPEL